MKIALITPEYITENNWFGGLSNYIYKASCELKKRGHHVEIFVLSNKNERFLHEKIIINRYRLDIFSKLALSIINRLKFFPISFKTLINSYATYKSFRVINNSVEFDILQIHSYQSLGYFLTKKKNLPIVSRLSSITKLLRDKGGEKLSIDKNITDLIEIKTIEQSDRAYAPSQFLSKKFKHYSTKKISVINPPFRMEYLNSKKWISKTLNHYGLKQKIYILYFGSIHPLKGVDLILSEINYTLTKYKNLHFVFVGSLSSNYLKKIEKQVEKWKGRVIIIPPVHHTELFPIIKNSFFVILPSLVENYSNAVIEAMALGKIVLATEDTSSEELIRDGHNGFLIPIGSQVQFRKKICKIINLTKKRKQAIEFNSKIAIKKLSPQYTITKLENFYNDLISKQRY